MSEALLHGEIVLCSPPEDLVGVARQVGSPALPASDPVVLTTEELSLAAVREAIATKAVALVSTRGNFAAHGVNLLRAHARNTGQQVTVLVGVPALPVPGSAVRITPKGEMGADIGAVAPLFSKRRRSRTELDATTLVVKGRCYWPHRRYDTLTTSLMVPGLTADASALAGDAVSIRRTRTGHLWFSELAPSPSRLTQLALDGEFGVPRLQSQAGMYERLMAEVASARHRGLALSLADVAHLIKEYFSIFIAFHDDYDEILSTLITDTRYSEVMQSRLTEWMLSTGADMPLKKDLLEAGGALPLPPVLPTDDLNAACSPLECPSEQLAAAIFVVKEWKFFMNKLLFREFSVASRGLVRELGTEAVRSTPIDELCPT